MADYEVKQLDRLKWDMGLLDTITTMIDIATKDGELTGHRPNITGDEKIAFVGEPVFGVFGFVLFFEARPRVLWVDQLFVDLPYRGDGVAKALMSAVLDYAKLHGYLRVEYGTMSGNTASRRLGAKLGFDEVSVGLAIDLPDKINPAKVLPRMPGPGEDDIPF